MFVRATPAQSTFHPSSKNPNVFHSDSFDRLTAYHPQPNIKSLDDVLIGVVSEWKRNLYSDLGTSIRGSDLTSLFNTIIFVRALEDEQKWKDPSLRQSQLLLELVDGAGNRSSMGTLLAASLERLGIEGVPFESAIIKPRTLRNKLSAFDPIDNRTTRALFESFYRHPWIPYRFDFAVISKHALSRIYEKYVVELRDTEGAQKVLFKDLPAEVTKKDLGAIYTPHFIARFFARAVEANVSPNRFLTMTTLDPSVGSGIFLRTMIEQQCSPTDVGMNEDWVSSVVASSWGVDIDPDACNAARLSLALLHLSYTGRLPNKLNIVNSEAMKFAWENTGKKSYDVVVTNPPFVKYERLQPEIQERVRNYLGEYGRGRVDLYLALLKVALDFVSDTGFVLYVLPEAFLQSSSAQPLRELILAEFDILYLVDLTAVPVFEGVGAYVVLLVLQRKLPHSIPKDCYVAKVKRNLPGALTSTIRRQAIETDSYSVFPVPQSSFDAEDWRVQEPGQQAMLSRIERHPNAGDILDIRQGVVSGQDDVFRLPADSRIVKQDATIWRPFLSDREMMQYQVPVSTANSMFYPFDCRGEKLSQRELVERYPSTWQHLKAHQSRLAKRRSVISGRFEWWELESPRDATRMLSPKIVCPHVMLTPKFSIDVKGEYLVSRTFVMTCRDEATASSTLLRYMAAVLNSPFSFWQLQRSAHSFRGGYMRVESSALKTCRVPDPSKLSTNLLSQIVEAVDALVSRRTSGKELKRASSELNNAVREAYGLTEAEATMMGWVRHS